MAFDNTHQTAKTAPTDLLGSRLAGEASNLALLQRGDNALAAFVGQDKHDPKNYIYEDKGSKVIDFAKAPNIFENNFSSLAKQEADKKIDAVLSS